MNWAGRISLTLATVATLFSFAGQPTAKAQERKSNIVFILVDNTGWGDWRVYGGTTATPRIDKLASEGIRFLNYNVEVEWTPSRSAIMTGRHPVGWHLKRWDLQVMDAFMVPTGRYSPGASNNVGAAAHLRTNVAAHGAKQLGICLVGIYLRKRELLNNLVE